MRPTWHSIVFILCITLGSNGLLRTVYAQDTPNTITLDNHSGELALVKLVGPTGQTIEVPQRQSRTVNVAAGEYYLLVRYGSKAGQYSYTKGDIFTVQQTATQYSAITITLHKVVGGNYPAHPTSREEFDKVAAGVHRRESGKPRGAGRWFRRRGNAENLLKLLRKKVGCTS